MINESLIGIIEITTEISRQIRAAYSSKVVRVHAFNDRHYRNFRFEAGCKIKRMPDSCCTKFCSLVARMLFIECDVLFYLLHFI